MLHQSCTIWSILREFNIMVGTADLQSTRHTTEVSCSMYKDEHTATFRQESHWCTGQHFLSTNSPTDAQISISCPQTVPLMNRSVYPAHKHSHWCTCQHILSTYSPTDEQISVPCPQTVPLMHRSSYPVHKQFPGLLLKPLYLTPFADINRSSLRALRVPTCDRCMVLSPGCLNAFHHTKIFSFSWTLSGTREQALLCSRMMLSVNIMVFVLDLITQFLKCVTVMVCTDVSSHGTMSRSRKPSVRKEENAYRILVEKTEE